MYPLDLLTDPAGTDMFFVRFILVVLLISVAIKILSMVGRYLQSQFGEPQVKAENNPTGIKEMVRDPVCGLYIPERWGRRIDRQRQGRSLLFGKVPTKVYQ